MEAGTLVESQIRWRGDELLPEEEGLEASPVDRRDTGSRARTRREHGAQDQSHVTRNGRTDTAAHSRIILADDHPLIRHAIRDYLGRSPDLQIVAELEEGEGLEQVVQKERPDLLILDLSMESDFSPVQAVRQLRKMQPDLKVLVLSAHNEPRWVIEMLEVGVNAYVHKTEPLHTLAQVIRRVLNGEAWYSHCLLQCVASEYWHDKSLASHERMVLQIVADGGDLARLASELGVSERTVSRYLCSAMEKLGVRSRLEAVVTAMRKGLIE